MFVDITIKNYLSFKEEVTFSMLGNSSKDLEGNYYSFKDRYKILKTAAIYGPNASGKSNLLRAIQLVKNLIVYGTQIGPNMGTNPQVFPDWVPLEPFRLSSTTKNDPSEFELNFIIDQVTYRYKFSLTKDIIVSEELYSKKSQKEKKLFTRNHQDIKIHDFDDVGSKNQVLENRLALTKFAENNSDEAKLINQFFHKLFVFKKVTTPVDTFEMLKKDEGGEFKKFLLNFVKTADPGIEDLVFEINTTPLDNFPDEIRKLIMENSQKQIMSPLVSSINYKFVYPILDDHNEKISVDLFGVEFQSLGTKKMFDWAGTFYNIMKEGMILFIDELDDSLHSLLQEYLVQSLHSTNVESKFQVVFTTHNTKLMNVQSLFRRDQIWFVDKREDLSSEIYSLLEIRDRTRKDTVIEKNYYKGQYGAIPSSNYFNDIFDKN